MSLYVDRHKYPNLAIHYIHSLYSEIIIPVSALRKNGIFRQRVVSSRAYKTNTSLSIAYRLVPVKTLYSFDR